MDTKELKRVLRDVAPGGDVGRAVDYGQTLGRGFEDAPSTHPGERGADGPIAPGNLALGDRVSAATEYVVGQEIGRGGMGRVVRARQVGLHRDVAIKALKPSRVVQPGCEAAFLAEAAVLALLDHPGIVPIYDLVTLPDGQRGIVMREVTGHSWFSRLHPGTKVDQLLAEETTLADHVQILLRVGDAVAHAHSRGILHRDLKPSNVMLGEFGEVMVMDWGMAVCFEPPQGVRGGQWPRLAQDVNLPGGSPGYMAPEMAMARGDQLGPWTDIYLLGAILYEVLVGEMPHQGNSLYEVVKHAFKGDPPELPSSVPEELRAICVRAMARNPKQRFESVRAMQDALRRYLRHRESHAMVAAADQKLLLLQSESASRVLDREAARTQTYQQCADALAGYRQAQVLWPDNPAAADGEAAARLLFARKAYESADFGLALSHLEGLRGGDADGLRSAVDQALLSSQRRQLAERQARVRALAAAALVIAALLGVTTWLSVRQSRTGTALRAAEQGLIQAVEGQKRAQASEEEAHRQAFLAAQNLARVEASARDTSQLLQDARTQVATVEGAAAEARLVAQSAERRAEKAERELRTSRAAEGRSSRESEAREAELVRIAERESKAKEEAQAEVQRLTDYLTVQRLEQGADSVLLPSASDALRRTWLADAAGLTRRLGDHRRALLRRQVVASGGRRPIAVDLRRLDELVDRLERHQAAEEAVVGVRNGAADREMLALKKQVATLESNVGQYEGYTFRDAEDRWRYELLRDLVRRIDALAGPSGLLDRIQAARSVR